MRRPKRGLVTLKARGIDPDDQGELGCYFQLEEGGVRPDPEGSLRCLSVLLKPVIKGNEKLESPQRDWPSEDLDPRRR